MAKKIDSAIAERLTALGIKAKNEEEARTKLLKILADNDIDGMEEEDTDSLLDMAESMVDVDDDRTDDEREADELADEVEDEDEEEDTKEEADEVEDEDEEEDPEPEEKPAKKSKVKSDKPKKSAVKTDKPKKMSKRGVKLDPMHNKEDRKEFKFLEKFFPTDKYEYRWLSTNGVTIKYKGANSARAMVTIEGCAKQENGNINCNMYLLTFSKSLQKLDEKDIEYELCWNGAPFQRGITFTEVEEVIAQLLELMEETVNKIDKRLGDNRKKMEVSLKKTTKKETAKKATKTAEPEDEDDEEDDEDEAPAKPVKKSAPAKKATKKSTKKAEDDDDDEEEDEDDKSKKPAKKSAKKSKK